MTSPLRPTGSNGLRGLLAMAVSLATACGEPTVAPRTLSPATNPFGPGDSGWAPQPHRERPSAVAVEQSGAAAWVALPGTVDAPGRHIARVALPDGATIERVEVGAMPCDVALHPAGRWLVVPLLSSDALAVVDAKRRRLAHYVPGEFYNVGAAFTPDGERLVVVNRWRDAAAIWRTRVSASGLEIVERGPWLSVGENPGALAIDSAGTQAAVGALTGTDLYLLDMGGNSPPRRIVMGAPIAGLAFVGSYLVATTVSASTHHLPFDGPDGDGDGQPGDGTPNLNFSDLQNEIAVVEPQSGAIALRVTSDSIWGRDYRDVHPLDTARHGQLLPGPDRRIVGGALPHGIAAVGPDRFVVTYAGSNELQAFRLAAAPLRLTPEAVRPAGGHAPHGIAAAGAHIVVTHRLSETLGVYAATNLAAEGTFTVGDVSGGAFPATDAEIGELVNDVTAPFSVDGDATCVHCHREQGNVAKAFSMPLLARAGASSRMTMAYRGAADSRPWFHEAAMDQDNFLPVLNELMRVENFCCTDYTLWGPGGAPADCASNPPPQCATSPNASSFDGVAAARLGREPFAAPRPTAFASRDAHVLAVAARLIGRTTSFGEGLFATHPITGARSPIPLDFLGITRALGLFLLQAPRLLPNPNPLTAAARRGEALFFRADVGCSRCHVPPTFGLDEANPLDGEVHVVAVVSQTRDADGTNLDLLAPGFVATFPRAQMDRCEDVQATATCAADPSAGDTLREVRFGVPQLRGLWDRAARMLHHGAAKNLREVLCTPGHPALRPGEVGRNERDGTPDTHGGTSHLDARQIEELEAFLATL